VLAKEPTFAPNRKVMVEGLAILRLAERLGIPTKKDYKLCPRLAREATYAPFEPLAFPGVGLEK